MLVLLQTELSDANDFIAKYHRHHKPVVGHRFSLGCGARRELIPGLPVVVQRVGVAIVGRPVARMCDQRKIVEVTRLCTDGTKNACSFLYATAARVAKDLGYEKIQTYILETEDGTSLKAAGYVFEATTGGGHWEHNDKQRKSKGLSGKTRRNDQPECPKHRWVKYL